MLKVPRHVDEFPRYIEQFLNGSQARLLSEVPDMFLKSLPYMSEVCGKCLGCAEYRSCVHVSRALDVCLACAEYRSCVHMLRALDVCVKHDEVHMVCVHVLSLKNTSVYMY